MVGSSMYAMSPAQIHASGALGMTPFVHTGCGRMSYDVQDPNAIFDTVAARPRPAPGPPRSFRASRIVPCTCWRPSTSSAISATAAALAPSSWYTRTRPPRPRPAPGSPPSSATPATPASAALRSPSSPASSASEAPAGPAAASAPGASSRTSCSSSPAPAPAPPALGPGPAPGAAIRLRVRLRPRASCGGSAGPRPGRRGSWG